MIDRQGGQIVFECDSCGAVQETHDREFSTAWGFASREGWRTRKLTATDWIHACPECDLA